MKKFLIAITVVVLAAFAVPALAASNPFMDVPANHWSYDAVAQLASRGVISGYPDGSYKGGQPATRYEMASTVARALAKIDMEKASKQDLELLKKLVLELKDELDALGVKVDKIDSRLAVMEKDLGGWSMSGNLRFDAKFGADENNGWFADDATISGKNEFDLNRYRIFLKKRIDANTTFTARLGSAGNNDGGRTVVWDRYFVTTKLPYDVKFTVGRQGINWEDDLGFCADNAVWFGDLVKNMFLFEKDWGMANLKLSIARQNDSAWSPAPAAGRTAANVESFMFAAMANFNITEQFKAGLLAYYYLPDKEVVVNAVETDTELATYGVYMKYAFTPSIEMKALYYHQTQGNTFAARQSGAAVGTAGYDDKAKAWKLIVDVKQDALKFTGLRLEYGKMDNNFMTAYGTGSQIPYAYIGADMMFNQKLAKNTNTATVFGATAAQKWNDKWDTFLRYYQVDADTAGIDDATNWTVGVGYQYSPAIKFELAYDKIDYGTNTSTIAGLRNGDDNVVRFRTFVTF